MRMSSTLFSPTSRFTTSSRLDLSFGCIIQRPLVQNLFTTKLSDLTFCHTWKQQKRLNKAAAGEGASRPFVGALSSAATVLSM